VPFRATFDCLWCGAAHTCRGPDDLEGWAQLCPDCVGKAGDNGFLRFRLHQALTERGAAKGSGPSGVASAVAVEPKPAAEPERAPNGDAAAVPNRVPASNLAAEQDPEAALLEYYEARAPEYDDWYLRRGRYERGPVHDAAWNAELDAAGRWLDELPIGGEIVELAAGTGWWSPLLASKGELSMYDGASAPLDRARERLVAHRLRAHLHVRDAWAEPDRPVDALFTGFWLSHVPRARLDEFLGVVRRWLKPGGTFAFIDSLLDPQSSAADHPLPSDDTSIRRLDDGREFTIVKVYYEPAELEAALTRAGFEGARVTTTGRFFLIGVARAARSASVAQR
jgi:SAM-dependent methyltransferase